MDLPYIPYLFLLFASVLTWKFTEKIFFSVILLSVCFGLWFSVVEFLGIASLLTLAILAKLSLQKNIANFWRRINFISTILIAILLLTHSLPGFNNLIVFDKVRISPDAVPFTMYLNLDKTFVGLILWYYWVRTNETTLLSRGQFKTAIKYSLFLIATILPLVLFTNYVRVDFKIPNLWWIWILNNLFFVCLSEEVFFRGVLQNKILNVLPPSRYQGIIAVLMASIAFGLAHYKGGLVYVLLASFAGLFYGYAYFKTQRIQIPILIHFSLNLVHFIAFSYPALAR